jgi:hypothetical protein
MLAARIQPGKGLPKSGQMIASDSDDTNTHENSLLIFLLL